MQAVSLQNAPPTGASMYFVKNHHVSRILWSNKTGNPPPPPLLASGEIAKEDESEPSSTETVTTKGTFQFSLTSSTVSRPRRHSSYLSSTYCGRSQSSSQVSPASSALLSFTSDATFRDSKRRGWSSICGGLLGFARVGRKGLFLGSYAGGLGREDHVNHWKIDRIVDVLLLPIIPVAFLTDNVYVNYALILCVGAHTHWGMESIVVDYLRPRVVGKGGYYAGLGVMYLLSFATFAGLLYLNYSQMPPTKAIKKLWTEV
ncbi:hypothetical protein BV898_04373 [Hypsibius exemplaris]|uniref:Succinate dehydrogenase [ubiquinone] cytochrome b small subunit n=1 Tax=Hypsibius exemplaris TaxID=2072580 RepID=A0A1W0X2X5_HYPEX|nr:hypothetical protein BV898_04373 [Hypsibius exemplaris]